MNRSDLIARDRNRLIQLYSKSISHGQPYALVDFPDHSNVGDSAIWLGEVAILQEITGRAPVYNCSAYNYDRAAMKAVLPAGATVFLHGGGNFGDIWPRHHEFRERMVEEWQDNPVVQLPQSIKFNDLKAAEKTAKLFRGHPNIRLLVRDVPSADFAKANLFDSPEIAPDSAFGIGDLKRTKPALHPMVALLRTDKETVEHDLSPSRAATAAPKVDWLVEPKAFRKVATLKAILQSTASGKWTEQDRRFAIYKAKAQGRLERGLDLLSEGQVVLTDRLHAHILSLMADIPHITLDNYYGKIRGYIDTFTKDYDHVFPISSVSEVDAALEQALASVAARPKAA